MRFYFGTRGWGWHMFGIGWKTKWFLGLSIRAAVKPNSSTEINACKETHANY